MWSYSYGKFDKVGIIAEAPCVLVTDDINYFPMKSISLNFS